MSKTIAERKAWRNPKTGRFTKAPKGKRPSKLIQETYQYQIDNGKIRRGILVDQAIGGSTHNVIVKHITSDTLSAYQGMLWKAISSTNAFAPKSWRGMRLVEVTIKGKDFRAKHHRIKLSLDITKETNIPNYLLGRIVGALHMRGLRTQYKLDVVPWNEVSTSKTFVRKMHQLQNCDIIIRFYR